MTELTNAELANWLRDQIAGRGYDGSDIAIACAQRLELLDLTVNRLQKWQDEAMVTLLQWDCCYDILEAAGLKAPLGMLKAEFVWRYLLQSMDRR